MAKITPSMFAGHSMLCPYEEKQRPHRYKAKPIRNSRTIVARERERWGVGLRAERGGSARKPVVLGEELNFVAARALSRDRHPVTVVAAEAVLVP